MLDTQDHIVGIKALCRVIHPSKTKRAPASNRRPQVLCSSNFKCAQGLSNRTTWEKKVPLAKKDCDRFLSRQL